MLTNLDPARGVPDALYEALQWEAATREEVCAGRVLRVHRDWLNGGFEQTFANLDAIEEPSAPYATAYADLELPTVAALVTEAAAAWAAGGLADEEWDALDQRYERLTYGEGNGQDDAIEAAVVRYIQQRSAAFTNAFVLAQQ